MVKHLSLWDFVQTTSKINLIICVISNPVHKGHSVCIAGFLTISALLSLKQLDALTDPRIHYFV